MTELNSSGAVVDRPSEDELASTGFRGPRVIGPSGKSGAFIADGDAELGIVQKWLDRHRRDASRFSASQADDFIRFVVEDRFDWIVLVSGGHLNKRGGGHSLYRGSGSIGIIAATRSGLMIGRSPDDPDLRVLCHVKNNLGRLAPSLLFEPVDVDGVPQIEWRGECDYTADDLLASPKQNGARLAEAMMFLNDTLAEGPVEQRIIKQRAVVDGMAYRTVERAKELLGVVSERDGWGPGSKCLWRLPVEENAIEEVPDETHRTPTILAWRSIDESDETTD